MSENKEATLIFEEIGPMFELFVSTEGTPYAAKRSHNLPIASDEFKGLLRTAFYKSQGYVSKTASVNTAVDNLADEARNNGRVERIYLRVAELDDATYVDLNNGGDIVKITAQGWTIIDGADCPARFRRPKNLAKMPRPIGGGDLAAFRELLNVDDVAYMLALAWMTVSFRTEGPLPILAVHGEQGSGKSNLTRMLRSIVDPNAAEVRAMPERTRDLHVAMDNSWCLAFDNVSGLSHETSDALCILSTGGTQSYRTHHKMRDEDQFSGRRPIILNGIGDLGTRGDLLERSYLIVAPTIPPEKRRTEKVIWARFRQLQPGVLGRIFDAVACGLRRQGDVPLDTLARMADAQVFAVAAAPALNIDEGKLVDAIKHNSQNAAATSLEAHPLAGAVEALLEMKYEGHEVGHKIECGASRLLELLNRYNVDRMRETTWPRNASRLGTELRRLATSLRSTKGIDIQFLTDGARSISITKS
jgi:energy-coupling factor transporter ATP-binding protein EcfA2